MLAVGRVHHVQSRLNREEGDEDDLTDTVTDGGSTLRPSRPPSDRPAVEGGLSARKRSVKFSTPGEGGADARGMERTVSGNFLGSLGNLLGFGGEAKAAESSGSSASPFAVFGFGGEANPKA